MAEGGASLSTEARGAAKTPEAKKLQRKVGKKEVKGFYYHAAEYQRQKQKERNTPHRILRGILEPFAIHIRAARLKHAAKKYGGEGSAVLDSQFVRQTLDKFWGKGLTEATKKQFRTKSQLHKVFEKYDVKKEDVTKIEETTTAIFSKVGNKEDLTPEEIQAYAESSGLSVGDIHHMVSVAKENAGAYMTADQIKGKFTEEAIYTGLSEQQQEQAKKLAHAALYNTITTALNYGKTAAVVAFLASNPVGWAATGAITLGSAGLSGLTRLTRLLKEGATHDISKARGIDVAHKIKGIERLLGVDWDEDPAKRGRQLARATIVGGLVALGARFAPAVLEHAGEFAHTATTDVGNAIGSLHEHTSNSGVVGTVLEQKTGVAQAFHEHLSGYEQPVKISYLPDTPHHDWQQLHTFVSEVKDAKGHIMTDGHGHPLHELKLSYNGVDDGIPHDQHYVDLMMPDGKQVFLQNDAVLATSGPDADKLIKVFGLVHEHGHTSFGQIGEVHSINLAHQIGLDQGRIDNFAKLTAEAHKNLWHGTQDASDLQTILHTRGLYNNGDNGNYLYGVRIGGGYYDSAHHVFRIGASNHYFNHHLLTDKLAREYPVSAGHPEPEQFHSVLKQPLSWIDEQEDRGIDWMFSPRVAHALDNFTDFGLNNTDADALAVQHMWEERPWLAPFLLTPYAAMGYFGYLYGKNRAGKKLTLPRAGVNTAAELALLTVLPGAAVTATIGYWIGKMKGRKGKEKAPKQTKSDTNPETKPGNQGGPSDAGGATATPAAIPVVQPAAPTPNPTVVPATAAGAGDETSLPPAPPPPPATPGQPTENLPATAAGEESPTAPPAPPVETNAEESVAATVPPPAATTAETPEAVESTQQIDETAPLAEDTYVQELYSLQKQTAQQLGLPQEQEQDLFHRLDDALRSGTYINIGRHMTKFENPDALAEFIANDFGFTTPEQTNAIQKYISEFETLHDRVAYTSAKHFAGEKAEKFDKEDYEEIRSRATVENIKQLYAKLKENSTDETLNKQLDEAIAIAMQIGVPYMWQGVLPWSDIFQTDFTSTVSFGWVNHGEGPTSAQVNATDEALVAQLRDAQIPLGDKSTLEVYEGLEPAQRDELVAKAAQTVATQYKQFLEEHDQTVEGASTMIAHLIKANIVKGQDIKQYPLPQRPFFVLD